jgi:hypothetical protein
MQLDIIESKLSVNYTTHLQGLDNLHSKGKITSVELNHLRFQFYNYFGTEPIGTGNSENGMVSHVMDFNLDWKKIISDHSKIIFKGTPATQFFEEV